MAHILIADDEASMRVLLCKLLGKHGHETSVAEDGEQAVEAFKKQNPDLVVMDLLMPNKGGLLAIQEIREHDPGAKIIAISGGGSQGMFNFLSTAATFSAVQTMEKPFTERALTGLISEMLAAGGPAAGTGEAAAH